MPPPSPFVVGRIVYVTVPDPQGRNAKQRPCVIVRRQPEDAPDAALAVVALTSTVDEIPPADRVDIPYPRAQLNGDPHPMTGLVCECAAACHWQTVVRESQVENVAGRVPTYLLDRILARVLELVAERAAKKAAGADEPPPA